MAMLKPLGIEKGKPFQPDARQRAILEEAGRIGDAMARTVLFDAEDRFHGANAIPSTNWNWVLLGESNPGNRRPMASWMSACTTPTARSTRRRVSAS